MSVVRQVLAEPAQQDPLLDRRVRGAGLDVETGTEPPDVVEVAV